DDVARTSWPDLVDTMRHRSPLLVGPADELVNTTEFFVHHEDVRRANDGWRPRPEDPRLEGTMWRVLRQRGRALFRRAPVGVRLELPDGRAHVVHDGQPAVTLRGRATEPLLYRHGRTTHAPGEPGGDPATRPGIRGP